MSSDDERLVAHDLNTLLTAIRGNAELLYHRLGSDPDMPPETEGILEASSRAAALMRELVAFNRKPSPQPRALDLHDVVSSLSRTLPATGGRIEVRTADVTLTAREVASLDSGLPVGLHVRLTVVVEPFVTNEPGSGRGLGLSTIDAMVRQAGGAIVVENAGDHGAAFTVYLPAVTGDPHDS